MTEYERVSKDIREAAAAYEFERLSSEVDALVKCLHEFETAAAADGRALLVVLRGKRRHLDLVKLAEAYIKLGFTDPRIHTLYAQALIELGRHVPAIGILRAIREDVEAQPSPGNAADLVEIYGVLGRAWKDIGFEALASRGGGEASIARKTQAARALNESCRNYRLVEKVNGGDIGGLSWYSVNLLGIHHLARHHGITLDQSVSATYAQDVIASLLDAEKRKGHVFSEWNLASLCELSVAAGKLEDALRYAQRCVAHPSADAFVFGSAERQLNLLWNIRAAEEGRAIHNLYLDALLRHQGGFALDPRQLRTSRGPLQLKLGERETVTLGELRNAFRIGNSVAMIRNNFVPIGTGFVVDATELGLGSVRGRVVVTNAHLISDPPQKKAIRPRDAQVSFELLQGSPIFYIKQIIRSFEVDGHDCTVLELREQLPAEALPLPQQNLEQDAVSGKRAYVVGHPSGQELSFSLFDSDILGCDPFSGAKPQRVHYRSPTFYGSSGSPVFNENWQVIALHRAGYDAVSRLDGQPGTYAANEGISLASIREALKAGSGSG